MSTSLVFLGTPQFAVPTLDALWRHPDFAVAGVVTQPDRPSGRGHKLSVSAVKEYAVARAIPVHQPPRMGRDPESLRFLARAEPQILIVVAFGQILKPEVFDFPPYGTLNVHASLLPRYRGASPIASAILNGDVQTGVTIMKIDEGMDSGPVLASLPIAIGRDQTAGELETDLADAGARLLMETLPAYLDQTITPVPQESAQATYAPLLKKEDGRIDWKRPTIEIHNQVRAMNPWPVAHTAFRGQPVKIWTARSGPGQGALRAGAGEIIGIREEGIEVACSNGSLFLTELQLAGRRRWPARDFANGTGVRPGERFGP